MALQGTSTQHLAEMRALYDAEAHPRLLERADALWEQSGDAPDAALGECWRFAMIAASRLGARGRAALWRARARSAFARSSSRNGLALTMLPDFFAAAELFSDDPSIAFGILDAMLATAGGSDDPVSADLVHDIYYEKRGFLRAQLSAATSDRAGLQQAAADYDQALSFPRVDVRRRYKIRAARLSVEYLMREPGACVEVADMLQGLIDEIEASGDVAVDVVRIARSNLSRMTTGDGDLEPYEVL